MSRTRTTPRRRRDGAGGLHQLPWQLVENPMPPVEVLRPDQIERIHEASLTILEEIGMDFLHDEAIEILRRAGAKTTPGSRRVRFDRGLVLDAVAKAPSAYTFHARNPERDVRIGGRSIVFASVGSAPNVSDIEGGRRVGNYRDYCNLLRLGQTLNAMHIFGGYPVEPVDLHPSTRHLDALRAFVTLSDKPFHAYALGRVRMRDGIEIARIARGVTRDQLQREPSLFTVVNTSSPLRLDGPMIEGLVEMAQAGQIVTVTPFTLAGAMAPATLAGALAQQNAEALATIALIQLIKPGAPVMYGGFTSNVDMKSGAPAFGTPEYAKAALAGGQLARRYGLPYRSSNTNASNAVDAQATYESMVSLWAAVQGHANMVMHSLGWLEGGLRASFEKMIIDAELVQTMTEFLKPIVVDDDTLGLDAIREVGPGGHFFGCQHTLARYETAFYAPLLSDWRNFESWQEVGAPDATQRAHQLYKRILAEYEPPPLDPAIAEELDAFVAKRKEEGGVPSD
ncbi:trimethylamine methyltransferase family protein [Inquilinus sp. OTU3971]|uniref:trimethylamine methyltransferase family protein n=1 Tax=Inquilinus sp. OTU3971 TaxID=3043855 RepID=UPI00313F2A83